MKIFKMEEDMSRRKFSEYPKTVYALFISGFILSFNFTGVYLTPFFKEWGGLTQFEIQNLQALFQIMVVTFEVPTGVVGDKYGPKLSVTLGLLLLGIAPMIYSIIPHLFLFVIAELLFALGVSFNSGAESALIKKSIKEVAVDKELKEEEFDHWVEFKQNRAEVTKGNLHSLGRVCAALIAPAALFLVTDLNKIFWLWVPLIWISFFIVVKWVKKDNNGINGSFRPSYNRIVRESIREIRRKPSLRRLILYITFSYSIGYFVIWLNQVYLEEIGVPRENWGIFLFYFTASQIVISSVLVRINTNATRSRNIAILIVIVVSVSLVISLLSWNIIGLIAFYTAGSFSLISRLIFRGQLTAKISDGVTSTVLSFAGIVLRMLLVVMNPIVGFLTDLEIEIFIPYIGSTADVKLFFAIVFLLIVMMIAIVFIPKEEDFR